MAKLSPDQHPRSTTYHQDQLFSTLFTKQSNPANALRELSATAYAINNGQQNQRKIAVDGPWPTACYYHHLNRIAEKNDDTKHMSERSRFVLSDCIGIAPC
ncbi:hypothetical protein [Mesorhizobium sp. M0047]|uniref:hypothetical protein n=1 Tax=Mesorhizobium sp. M0047 TaxID=2956859 RepID=UPI003335AC6D